MADIPSPKREKNAGVESLTKLPTLLESLVLAAVPATAIAIGLWVAPEKAEWTLPARVLLLLAALALLAIACLAVLNRRLWKYTEKRNRYGLTWDAHGNPICPKCDAALMKWTDYQLGCPICKNRFQSFDGPTDLKIVDAIAMVRSGGKLK
jgi:hypothetical protein